MPTVGPLELIVVLLIVLLVFGAKRLPEVGSSLGKGIREFKRSIREVKDSVDEVDSGPTVSRQVDSGAGDGEPKKLSE